MITKLYVKAATFLNEFKRDERGVTAIEYGLIGVAMAVALTAILGSSNGDFLKELTDAFDAIGKALSDAS
ncbi:Flp family type IVb pilin [Vibrio sp. SCSIO 43140]|uniref:Flp family type IVb pilin n=1 Tax=Vibrio sp. SCSIO 43140 TaxID=2819100 RepID=UPI00207624B0|nr:Flp family type IVb pilin [Vibrio sp. SCSIO 43140]USD61756.1 Flp family type IVb pilin [Vibrio sp. SCSIO 43140]